MQPDPILAIHGLWRHEPVEDGLRAIVHRRVIHEIAEAVADLKGVEAGNLIRDEGLGRLHEVIGALDITPIRDRVLDRLRDELLSVAVATGRSLLGWSHDFFIDDYLILRINLPYEAAINADSSAENPGVGRVSPWLRQAAAGRRVKDPLYDPEGYHRGLPPAAWAHGAHLDSWTGHSKDGLNIWWAIGDVPAEAGMVLYPQMLDQPLTCDPRTLYLKSGQRLPPPTFVPLAAGEMLIFDPEMLHGTHLNVSGRTRVAVSMRLNASSPRFDPDCFYAREFWRRASDIEAGQWDQAQHLKREDNLAPAQRDPPRAAKPGDRPVQAETLGDGRLAVDADLLRGDGARIVVGSPEGAILLIRAGGRVYAIDALCPHYGLPLNDGGVSGPRLHCPGCALGFDLRTGASATPSLRLRTYAVEETCGRLVLNPSADQAAADVA